MKITRKTSVEELAAIIVKHLKSKKIDVVMVGGSVVSIYTNNEYQSKDIDFISMDDHRLIKKLMSELGFESKGKNFFHPKTEFSVEFPTGPLALGDDVTVRAEGKININGVRINILSPTQCVMDRLASFYFFNDRQCLDQAVSVGKKQPINIKKIEQWSRRENEIEKFQIFKEKLKV